MKLFLPYRFKVAGAIIAPLGFTLWLAMQLGYVTKVLVAILGEPATPSPYHMVNVAVAVISFLSFLAGIYFVAFQERKLKMKWFRK